MGTFEENEVVATFDRSWQDKKERLQLERGEFNGKTVFMLRIAWLADDGSWRWSQAKPNANGRCWQAMSIRQKELRALGEALIKAAADSGDDTGQKARRSVKDTPERKAARDRFDEYPRGESIDDDSLPF